MPAPTWTQKWTTWFNMHRSDRDPKLPVGWYTIDELRQAFDAGARADHERGLEIIVDRIRQAVHDIDGTRP